MSGTSNGVTISTSSSSLPANSAIKIFYLGPPSTISGLVLTDPLSFGSNNMITFGAASGSTGASGIYHGTKSGTAAAPFVTARQMPTTTSRRNPARRHLQLRHDAAIFWTALGIG